MGSFKKGNVPWNKGLTKETDSRVKGTTTWNKGLTAETDERVASAGRKISLALKGRPQSEAHKRAKGASNRRFWARFKINDPKGWAVFCEASRARSRVYSASVREGMAARLRAEYGLPDDAEFVPVRFSEHLFARSLVTGSKAPSPVTYLRQHKRFYYPYKGGTFPSEGEEFGIVDRALVPLITVNGVTRTRARSVDGLGTRN